MRRTGTEHILDSRVLIGESAALAALRDDIASAARTNAKVLIVGETGVGKEVVARLIHERGARATAPFVAVNCSGIPETLLESELFGHVRGSFTGAYRDKVGLVRQADRGTLFLDELGEMSARMQAVLLRFAETGEVQQVGADRSSARADVRLITATNRDLRAQIAAGAFREDLYYRLNVIHISVPPLRERTDDVIPLVEYYLARAAETYRMDVPVLTTEAAELLTTYPWPGNVREVRNIAERLVLLGRSSIADRDLPPEIRPALPRPVALRSSSLRPADEGTVVGAEAPMSDRVIALWNRMEAGEDFWTVVHKAFKARELTRVDLAALIDRGLQHTCGSYRALLKVFNLPLSDYKRFHAFLYQQQCNPPVAPYRQRGPARRPSRSAIAS